MIGPSQVPFEQDVDLRHALRIAARGPALTVVGEVVRMAKRFRPGFGLKMANVVGRSLASRGWGPPRLHVLSVPGRKSGRVHSVPVGVIEVGGQRYLVGPYGETDWTRNARAAGEVTLSRGGRTERFRAVEVGTEEAAPVLREYLRQVRVVRSYFDATPDSPDESFAAEANTHPVFRLDPPSDLPGLTEPA
jgi:deazaflavin-dependent oxidoreductase (nitroreductase family)